MEEVLRQKIVNYIINRFKVISENNNKISLIDLWNVQLEVEEKFNITDNQSQGITTEVLEVI
tara:strand:- start:325 stop:510 length:186 start_codon:yes stop_codon:yes gene_type:complete